jgi:hypothetical protein
VYRSTILPEETAGSYLADVALVNGRSPTEVLRSAEKAWPPKQGMSERLRPLIAIAGIAGLAPATFRSLHTHVHFKSAFHPIGQQATILNLTWGCIKYCRSCAREDIAFRGRPYARRAHQLKGVYWCSKHDYEPLWQARSIQEMWRCRGAPLPYHVPWRHHTVSHRALLARFFIACELFFGRRCTDLGALHCALHDKATDLGVPLLVESPRSSKRMLSEVVWSTAPQLWVESVYPGWRFKKPGVCDFPDKGGDLPFHCSTELVCILLASHFQDRELEYLVAGPGFVDVGLPIVTEAQGTPRSSATLIGRPRL